MSARTQRIMIVDDNRDDIFFHTRTIRKAHPEIEVIPMLDAADAVEYLKSAGQGGLPAVDLIFLDINMPGMSGWDFLDLSLDLLGEAAGRTIVMLTTSSRDEERERALAYRTVIDFKTKPLTPAMLEEILNHPR